MIVLSNALGSSVHDSVANFVPVSFLLYVEIVVCCVFHFNPDKLRVRIRRSQWKDAVLDTRALFIRCTMINIETRSIFIRNYKNYKELQIEWTNVVRSIMESPEICDFRNKVTKTSAFWAQYMQNESIQWTPKVCKYRKIILTLPNGNDNIDRDHSVKSRLLKSHQKFYIL